MPSVDLAVADTMGLWIDVATELESLLSRVHGVVMNEEEAHRLLVHLHSLMPHRLLDLGPNFAVVKGQHGCIIASRDGLSVLPAWPSLAGEVRDPTGGWRHLRRRRWPAFRPRLPFAERPSERRRSWDGCRQLYHR